MSGKCCIRILKRDFEENNIKVININQGFAEIEYDSEIINEQKIRNILALSDLSLIKNNEEKIVEKVKLTIRELIFEMNNVDSIAKKTEYIVEKLGLNYRYPALFIKNQKYNCKKIDYSGIALIARYPHLDYFLPKVHFSLLDSSLQILCSIRIQQQDLTP